MRHLLLRVLLFKALLKRLSFGLLGSQWRELLGWLRLPVLLDNVLGLILMGGQVTVRGIFDLICGTYGSDWAE